jgi:hypothetical protein
MDDQIASTGVSYRALTMPSFMDNIMRQVDAIKNQGSVPVLGPDDLSFDDMAQIMSEVLGRPVRFQQIPGAAFKAGLVERGMSEAMAQGMLDMWVAKDNGIDNADPRTPESTTPTSFRQWCEDVLEPAVRAQS